MTICFDKRLLNEIDARKKFVTDVFKVNLVVYKEDEKFVLYKSFPFGTVDILYIVGHNKNVADYIQNHTIEEKTIVIVACDLGCMEKYKIPNKTVFLSYRDEYGLTRCRCGENYGFDFDPTVSELKLFNCNSRDIYERVSRSFDRIV